MAELWHIAKGPALRLLAVAGLALLVAGCAAFPETAGFFDPDRPTRGEGNGEDKGASK